MSQLKVNSIIPVAGVPTGGGGGIIQVLQSFKNDVFSTSSTSYVDLTGMSVSITPSSSSSKILIFSNGSVGGSGTNTVFFANLVRGSTNIAQPSNTTSNFHSTATQYDANRYTNVSWSHNYLDSPNTTSEVTYKWQVKASSGTIFFLNRGTNNDMHRTGSMIVMEVSA